MVFFLHQILHTNTRTEEERKRKRHTTNLTKNKNNKHNATRAFNFRDIRKSNRNLNNRTERNKTEHRTKNSSAICEYKQIK